MQSAVLAIDGFCQSVCPSVRQVPILCPDEWRYDRAVFSIWLYLSLTVQRAGSFIPHAQFNSHIYDYFNAVNLENYVRFRKTNITLLTQRGSFVYRYNFWFVSSTQIWQFHRRFDQCLTHRHGTYALELRRLRSVPGRRWIIGHGQSEVCLQPASVQISHRAVSERWQSKHLWAGGLHSWWAVLHAP